MAKGTKGEASTRDDMAPPTDDVQSHYDRSNEFFKLVLDPTMTYSCAYWEDGATTLQEAQMAKVDMALGKLGLKPGMTLLDIGSGWGSTMRRAVEKHDVNVIGLTLSENQLAYAQQKFDEMDSPRSMQVRLQGWEEFNEPVDRIVSIGAFEHFADGARDYGFQRYNDFFKMCYNVLPDDGVMLLHSIVVPTPEEVSHLPRNMKLFRFISFILKEIYPGGKLPMISTVDEPATNAGFDITRHHRIGKNYIRTLDTWAKSLEAHTDEAIALKGQEHYDIFMHYLTGCRELFRDGYTDVCQFTMVK
jgi:cyclopropane-fatty-acyl-phospholipid synthase